MACITHFVDVRRADTELDIREACSQRVLLAHEVGDKGMHASRREERGWIILGNETRSGDDGMTLGLEEFEVRCADLGGRFELHEETRIVVGRVRKIG